MDVHTYVPYYTKTSRHVYFAILRCKRRVLLCSHSNGDIFTCEDNMLFSHVKISSFRSKAHLVFNWCLYDKIRYVRTYDSLGPNFLNNGAPLRAERESSAMKQSSAASKIPIDGD